jgi:phosphate transport system substrate-binding protein
MGTHPDHCSSSTTRRRTFAGVAVAVASGAIFTGIAVAQAARDYISIVGSSTVYPFATVVAEQFGRSSTRFKAPKIESTGSGGGIQLFCNGVGIQHPDVANSSRRIHASELATCARNGVTEVVEVKIGYDGIVLANSNATPKYSLTREQIFLALAKQVPDPAGSGRLVANPYRRWSDVDASLPTVNIEVLGPPPTSGTRDAFLELVMDPGCAGIPAIVALEGAARLTACHTMREDGLFIEAGENDNLIVQKLESNPRALGIFGYSFLDQNRDKVHGSAIDGVTPEFEAIADGSYPVARPLYFYVKKAHVGVIPGIAEYLREFTGEAASGEFGYLTDRGLIPLPEAEREAVLAAVQEMGPMQL